MSCPISTNNFEILSRDKNRTMCSPPSLTRINGKYHRLENAYGTYIPLKDEVYKSVTTYNNYLDLYNKIY